jgi:hypothetical protein
MTKISRNFLAGRMNKVTDYRILPEGEYIDAMNVRMGSTEKSDIGVIENTKGNLALTTLVGPNGGPLSIDAKCIGAIEDSANETLYWFVHDKSYVSSATGVCDLIVSYNIFTNILTYHVISIDDGSGLKSTLNFNEKYLITGVNIIGGLLFFTDNYNPPRFINTQRNYANPIAGIDQVTAEELLVIKRPPIESPKVQPIITSGQENYMDTRFISFAYRYRYIDGEYSATSQWSQVAFIPQPFQFSVNSMLNDGMQNVCNAAIITYNSGSSLVVGIDLLFKQSANNIIKVIEKLDKDPLGANNTEMQYTFSSSKIFTILNSSELLRLYDNVPRYAQAQTIMGNRLMYGNYVDGYNLIDKFGMPIKLEYFTSLITEPIGTSSIPDNQEAANYSINGPQTIPNAATFIDLAGKTLSEGSLISVEINIGHSQFSGSTPFPTETTDETSVFFNFLLANNYTSVYQLATSSEFQAAVGTSLPIGNIKPVYSSIPGTETSCDGTTFTDNVNCVLPNNLNLFTKVASGISAEGQAIQIITSPASSKIGFQFVAMKYVDNITAPTATVYEYYEVTFTSATFQEIANPQSLHSNRGYEIGIIYMDDYNRSSTALVSPNNTEHIPCGYSANKNGIRVTIPVEQRAPVWAKRYKFVIKPDEEFYETVYCNIFFTDPDTNEVWFLLEGENARKIEVGDRLIVKADTSGPVLNCAYATVLEKTSQSADFIVPKEGLKAIAGVYMKINPNSFNAVSNPLSTILSSDKRCTPLGGLSSPAVYTTAYLQMNVAGTDPLHPSWTYVDYSIPAGSRIVFDWDWHRNGAGSNCSERGYIFKKTFIASRNYDNMEDWFKGDHIASTLNTGVSRDGDTKLQFLPTNGVLNTFNFSINYLQFYRDPVTNSLLLQFGSGLSCNATIFGGDNRRACVTVSSTVYRATNTLIFETEPSDALPDVFFENNLSFSIDDNGNHSGNVQNQDINANLPGIIDTEFFNCFAFGNGAESYKVRDSIIGKYFNLGERVNTVSAQDYKEAHRFADITYSGIYNAETNVNKLNEFNLGLLDYKNLETSFGPIYILDGRETDVLVLQEDKISYVLAGKNLLSDSAAGGAITSVPEVLGTQIARTEKYGISFNPESYVQWGANRYFTDVKRGSVLNIKGDSMSQDQLIVISEFNMRTWFRDEFNTSFNTQKLGGYDPYMNEYVLSTNNTSLPIDIQCLNCGVSQTLTLTRIPPATEASFKYCVDLGPLVGSTKVSWNLVSAVGGDFKVNATYNGTLHSSGWVDASGEINFLKDDISVETVEIEIIYASSSLIIDVLVDCPIGEVLTVVEVVLTNNSDYSKSTHVEYRYTNGAFIGPLQSNAVIFTSSTTAPVVSRYNAITGYAGSGSFPPELSTMMIRNNQIPPDTYVFDPLSDKFKYLRTNVLYPNTTVGINSLLALALTATPIVGGGSVYSSEFTVPSKLLGNYLYLIWDYRDAFPIPLCFDVASNPDARKNICCNCTSCNPDIYPCVTLNLYNPSETQDAEIYFPNGNPLGCNPSPGPFSVQLEPLESTTICAANDFDGANMWSIVDGFAIVTINICNCP